MNFRRARRTNDWFGWLTFGACLFGAAVTDGIAATLWVGRSEAGMGHLCFGSLGAAFTVVTSFAGWRLFRPQEWECVVDESAIRWGPTDRLERQQRVRLADIRRVSADEREQVVVIETEAGRTVCGDFVLIRKADRQALIAFLNQHHPAFPCANGP